MPPYNSPCPLQVHQGSPLKAQPRRMHIKTHNMLDMSVSQDSRSLRSHWHCLSCILLATLAGVELFRIIVCAGNCTARAPANLLAWDPNRVGWIVCPAAGHAAATSKRLRAKIGRLWRTCTSLVHIRINLASGCDSSWLALTPSQVEDLDTWPQQSIPMQP